MGEKKVNNNPVGRLASVILVLMDHGTGNAVQDAIASALHCEVRTPDFYERYAKLLMLIDEAQNFIREMDVDQTLYQSPISEIRSIFMGVPLQNPRADFVMMLKQHRTSFLFVVEAAGRQICSESIAKDDLSELIDAINGLANQVRASNTPDALKLAMLECLTRLRAALEFYFVVGNDGVEEAVAFAVGTLVLNGKALKDSAETGVAAEVWAVIQKAGSLLSLAKNAKDLLPAGSAEFVKKLLSP